MTTATTQTSYEPVAGWGKLPMGVTFRGDATSIAVDSKDNVYVFNRGTEPIAVFDTDGNFLRGMGHGEFVRPHGIEIDGDDNLYLVDDNGHIVQKRTNDGEVVFTIGTKGEPCEWQSGGMFNRPTDVAIHPVTGELFVSDGYGGHRVHKFSADGELLHSWGMEGSGEGTFKLLHNIWVDSRSRVFIADRENDLIQIFDADGNFLEQWDDVVRPGSMVMLNDIVYVIESGPQGGISIFDLDHNLLSSWRSNEPQEGSIIGGHGICVDLDGNIYVTEIGNGARVTKFQKV